MCGSPALEIGIADKALRGEHLIWFAGEYSKERVSRRHWVELYRVRRGY